MYIQYIYNIYISNGIKTQKDELLKVSHKLAEEMYKAAAEKQKATAGAAAGGTSNGASGSASGSTEAKDNANVVDAEIVDEGKK